MIKDGKIIGEPEVMYKDTTANIEALANPVEGMHAYSTDDHKEGAYNGAAWDWGAGVSAVEDLTTTENDTDLRLAPDGAGGVEWAAGGGGGAPTDAPYVTTAADGDLSAEVVIPGLAGSPDIAGKAGGGISEEYDTVTTGLTWDVAPATENSNTTEKSHLYLKKTAQSTSLGIRDWTPGAGTFDARCKVGIGTDNVGTPTGQIGLYIQNSGASVRAVIRYGIDSVNKRNYLDVYTYASSTWTARGGTWYFYGCPEMYLRITRDGSNNLTFWCSLSGKTGTWQIIVTQALTLTVAKIGYYLNHDAGGAGVAIYAISDWLRTDV